MNVDKIKGGLGFSFINPENPEPVTITRPAIYLRDSRKNEEWKNYKKLVWELTECVRDSVPGVEMRGFKNHHIDHIHPIWHGFKMGIPAEMIADISNLMMLPYRDNMKKGRSLK